ncbi:MAG TPA: hypothetical protein VH092_02740 [Urbifossiella sp.]|nr:hypothetical protein [Urbifossiella sp.]
MTGLVRRQLAALAGAVADLKERVRLAVAGELARALGGAVQRVVEAAAAGRPDPPPPSALGPPTGDPRPPAVRRDDDWDDDWDRPDDPWGDDPYELESHAGVRRDRNRPPAGWDDDASGRVVNSPCEAVPPPAGPPPVAPAGAAAAIAAGVYAARWWLTRQGTVLAATGIGLGVGLLGALGGPVVRTAIAAFAAAADLLAATDALGAGAARLDSL